MMRHRLHGMSLSGPGDGPLVVEINVQQPQSVPATVPQAGQNQHRSRPSPGQSAPSEQPKTAPANPSWTPSLNIDDHTLFWSIYNQMAGEHEEKLLNDWNRSIDATSMNALIFSAISGACSFMTLIWSLKQDTSKRTNEHLRDNTTPETNLSPRGPSPSPITARNLLTSSFSFSLAITFTAYIIKQWLGYYELRRNHGLTKPLHIQGRERHKRLMSIEKWRVGFIIKLLSFQLLIPLTLFILGVASLYRPIM